METVLSKALLVYGPLGIIAAIAIFAAVKLYRDLGAVREAHAKELKELRAAHTNEIKEMQDHYVTKSETWMQKYYDLSKALNDVLASIVSRYDRR